MNEDTGKRPPYELDYQTPEPDTGSGWPLVAPAIFAALFVVVVNALLLFNTRISMTRDSLDPRLFTNSSRDDAFFFAVFWGPAINGVMAIVGLSVCAVRHFLRTPPAGSTRYLALACVVLPILAIITDAWILSWISSAR